jgi:hypothetical protein
MAIVTYQARHMDFMTKYVCFQGMGRRRPFFFCSRMCGTGYDAYGVGRFTTPAGDASLDG